MNDTLPICDDQFDFSSTALICLQLFKHYVMTVIGCFRIENIWLYWIDIEEYGRCITT